MAVKTKFSRQDFDQILSHYNLGTCDRSEPISQGTVQTNYCILTTQGKVIFRYYENRIRESVLFETELLTYLKGYRYPCPAPIQDQFGACVGTYQNKPFVIFEFIEGQHIDNPSEDHKRQLIQKVAELQIVTRAYRPRYHSYRLNYDIEQCRELAKQEAEKIGTQDSREKFAWLDDQLTALDLSETIPKAICHCDFHFSNVLFRDDQFVGLIDFDDANYTYQTFDLVCLVDTWAWPFQSDHHNLKRARAIVQAYNTNRSLNTVERRHIFDVHKLSILFDCIWYFGRGNADDFYEKRKIGFLNDLGRDRYMDAYFSDKLAL